VRVNTEMSTSVLTFNLVQKAKKNGGDKYECSTDSSFAIYFPQSVSRKADGTVHQMLEITIQPMEVTPAMLEKEVKDLMEKLSALKSRAAI
jgi:hypothetical protein